MGIRLLIVLALLLPGLSWGQSTPGSSTASETLSNKTYVSPIFTGTPTGSATSGSGDILLETSPTINSPTQTGVTTAVQTIGTYPATYGTFAQAVGCSEVVNGTHPPEVMGISPTSAISSYGGFDSVGCYFDNTAPPLVANVAGTYTATTFCPTVPFSSGVLSQLLPGMWVKSNDATYYASQISSWQTTGSTCLTVPGWYQQGGTAGTPSGTNALINPISKIWALNANVFLNNTSYATAAAGFELGLEDTSSTAATNATWLYDAVNLTSNLGNSAFIARGYWNYAFHVGGAAEGGTDPLAGFFSTQATGNVFQDTTAMTGGNLIRSLLFNVNYLGVIDIGSQTASGTTQTINFHSGGTSTADAQILSSNGNGSAGSGYIVDVASLNCFAAVSGCGNEALRVIGLGPGQANQIRISGALTGNNPSITCSGADTTVGCIFATKSNGAYTFSSTGAANFAGGVLSSNPSTGIGYAAGAGGAVTQLTSRTTGVTLNKTTGAITLFTAAGSVTATTFTVTDSAVAATDTIVVNEKSGTNLYEIFVTTVAAGSFNITFFTTGGTSSDSPVFNFSVIKAAAS